ncbi:MAG: M14 family zinc carboxypeptidase, partial [Myxococcota bacterium]
ASESETQAVEALYESTDYSLTIDWHSHSELVLFPWGHTRERAPDHEGLKAIAERFASFNGYTPQQSVELYATSGTSDGPGYANVAFLLS